ncbi:MAG: thermonuclease family protein [Alphaproteobacteria bacterium]|nr:thermonuclease family protein [Alphaproteobacteria bacterium]
MLWVKKIFCSGIGLFFVILGILVANDSSLYWLLIGGIFVAGGLLLAHIALFEKKPSYSFWITVVSIGLASFIFVNNDTSNKHSKDTTSVSERSPKKISSQKNNKKSNKPKGFDFSAYPKISGSAFVIHAHVFYIGNRYIRLYGVDAPDNDQLCSDGNGSAYNCGERAVSWVRNWIDNNIIDCYILKVEPNGRDLATCAWGEYDIGAGLVGSGWGVANTRETFIYKPYEIKAQNEGSGLWQGSFYSPEDWRDIKRHRNDFTVKKESFPSSKNFIKFNSWFK